MVLFRGWPSGLRWLQNFWSSFYKSAQKCIFRHISLVYPESENALCYRPTGQNTHALKVGLKYLRKNNNIVVSENKHSFINHQKSNSPIQNRQTSFWSWWVKLKCGPMGGFSPKPRARAPCLPLEPTLGKTYSGVGLLCVSAASHITHVCT